MGNSTGISKASLVASGGSNPVCKGSASKKKPAHQATASKAKSQQELAEQLDRLKSELTQHGGTTINSRDESKGQPNTFSRIASLARQVNIKPEKLLKHKGSGQYVVASANMLQIGVVQAAALSTGQPTGDSSRRRIAAKPTMSGTTSYNQLLQQNADRRTTPPQTSTVAAPQPTPDNKGITMYDIVKTMAAVMQKAQKQVQALDKYMQKLEKILNQVSSYIKQVGTQKQSDGASGALLTEIQDFLKANPKYFAGIDIKAGEHWSEVAHTCELMSHDMGNQIQQTTAQMQQLINSVNNFSSALQSAQESLKQDMLTESQFCN